MKFFSHLTSTAAEGKHLMLLNPLSFMQYDQIFFSSTSHSLSGDLLERSTVKLQRGP